MAYNQHVLLHYGIKAGRVETGRNGRVSLFSWEGWSNGGGLPNEYTLLDVDRVLKAADEAGVVHPDFTSGRICVGEKTDFADFLNKWEDIEEASQLGEIEI